MSGQPAIISGSGNRPLARAVASALRTDLLPAETATFPDGELHVVVGGDVRDRDVYVLQPTGPPAERNLFELLLLGDACRRAGARRITAVVPYFGYARQDRRGEPGEAVGVCVAVDTLGQVGYDALVVVEPHIATFEAVSGLPVAIVSAVPMLADVLRRWLPAEPVVVAPDLGGAKLAARYASLLGCPLAVVRKLRVSGSAVVSEEVLGSVSGCTPVIVDDMISTGGTVAGAVDALAAAGSRADPVVVATHGLFVGEAGQVLTDLAVRRLVVTDSLPPPAGLPPSSHVASLAPLLAQTIEHLAGSGPDAVT